MKNKKNLCLNLLIFIGSPALIIAGILLVTLTHNNRLTALGGALLCVAAFFLLMGFLRAVSLHSINKEKKEKEKKGLAEKQKREKLSAMLWRRSRTKLFPRNKYY